MPKLVSNSLTEDEFKAMKNDGGDDLEGGESLSQGAMMNKRRCRRISVRGCSATERGIATVAGRDGTFHESAPIPCSFISATSSCPTASCLPVAPLLGSLSPHVFFGQAATT